MRPTPPEPVEGWWFPQPGFDKLSLSDVWFVTGSVLRGAERRLRPFTAQTDEAEFASHSPLRLSLSKPVCASPPLIAYPLALRRADIFQEFHAKAQRTQRGCADTNVFAPSCEDFAKTPLTLSLLRGLVPATRLRQAQPERRMVCHRFTARPERCAAGD